MDKQEIRKVVKAHEENDYANFINNLSAKDLLKNERLEKLIKDIDECLNLVISNTGNAQINIDYIYNKLEESIKPFKVKAKK